METTELGELVQRETENEKIPKDGAQRRSFQGTAEGRNAHRRSRMWHPGHQGGQLSAHLPIYSIVPRPGLGHCWHTHSIMLLLING